MVVQPLFSELIKMLGRVIHRPSLLSNLVILQHLNLLCHSLKVLQVHPFMCTTMKVELVSRGLYWVFCHVAPDKFFVVFSY
ncbi:MAG: hypothetical protein ACI936_000631 [Paraglaciecola sp.]|jgi:hypothetical protein